MAFSRKFLTDNGVPEDKVDIIMAERNRTLTDYVPKTDMDAQIAAAVEAAKKEAPAIKVDETDEYKQLSSQFEDYKKRSEARSSDAFKAVKAKFFDAVYDKLDNEKDIAEQLTAMKSEYEEYFNPSEEEPKQPPAKTPQFSTTPGRAATNEGAEAEKVAADFKAELTHGLKLKG